MQYNLTIIVLINNAVWIVNCKCVLTIEWFSIRHKQLQDITAKYSVLRHTAPGTRRGVEERGDRDCFAEKIAGFSFYYQIINRNHLRVMKSFFPHGIILPSSQQRLWTLICLIL